MNIENSNNRSLQAGYPELSEASHSSSAIDVISSADWVHACDLQFEKLAHINATNISNYKSQAEPQSADEITSIAPSSYTFGQLPKSLLTLCFSFCDKSELSKIA